MNLQIYLSLICALLLAGATVRQSGKRIMELLHWHQMGWESEKELAAGIQRHAREAARKRQLAEARKRAAKNRTDPDGEVRNRTASRGAVCTEGAFASAPRRSSAFTCPALRSPGRRMTESKTMVFSAVSTEKRIRRTGIEKVCRAGDRGK
ncbi:MAG: hypothetical protein WCK55_17255 [Verrucomicrobiota bacterium]